MNRIQSSTVYGHSTHAYAVRILYKSVHTVHYNIRCSHTMVQLWCMSERGLGFKDCLKWVVFTNTVHVRFQVQRMILRAKLTANVMFFFANCFIQGFQLFFALAVSALLLPQTSNVQSLKVFWLIFSNKFFSVCEPLRISLDRIQLKELTLLKETTANNTQGHSTPLI